MYLTFEEYTAMGGTLAQTEFARLCARASSHIDMMTHFRIPKMREVPTVTKNACFDLINACKKYDEAAAQGNIASMSNDGVSISYRGGTEAKRDYRREREEICFTYFGGLTDDGGVPLLFAGVK